LKKISDFEILFKKRGIDENPEPDRRAHSDKSFHPGENAFSLDVKLFAGAQSICITWAIALYHDMWTSLKKNLNLTR
jgi:hypothetical protein